MDEPETQVRLEVVEATMSSPMFHDGALEPPMAPDVLPEVSELPEVPELPGVSRISVARRVEIELAIVAAIAVAASFVAADARVAIVAGSLGFLAFGTQWIDRHVPFSIGEGFVGYRATLDGRTGSRRTMTSIGTGRGARHPRHATQGRDTAA